MFRTPFSQNAASVLSACRRCGAPCLEDCSSDGRGKALTGGSITGRQTHGRHGPYPPPLPLSAPRGGEDGQGERWEPSNYLPYDLLRRPWQGHLFSMGRQTLTTAALNQGVAACVRTYPNGLVPNGHQGQVPSPSQSLARSVAN
jgi:hypothetical protein